jgi:alpha/beta superfamily hydrolase
MNDLPAPGDTVARFIDGPAGRLEASIAAPKDLQRPRGICVVCHPHPLFGGSMTNKVVWTLASSALKTGLLVARFNFRGVGRSAGLYDESRGETADALAVVEALRRLLPETPLVLAGFSFGAYVSLKAAATARPAALVGISGPFGRYVDGGANPPHPHCPWLTVHSTDDDTVDYESTRAVLDSYDPPPQFVRFEGAGHFFHGRLTELQAVVQPFLDNALAGPG